MPRFVSKVEIVMTVEQVVDAPNIVDAMSEALNIVHRKASGHFLTSNDLAPTCTTKEIREVSEYYGEGDAAK